VGIPGGWLSSKKATPARPPIDSLRATKVSAPSVRLSSPTPPSIQSAPRPRLTDALAGRTKPARGTMATMEMSGKMWRARMGDSVLEVEHDALPGRSFHDLGSRSPLPSAHALVHVERSEEHTSELQSLRHLVCRLL